MYRRYDNREVLPLGICFLRLNMCSFVRRCAPVFLCMLMMWFSSEVHCFDSERIFGVVQVVAQPSWISVPSSSASGLFMQVEEYTKACISPGLLHSGLTAVQVSPSSKKCLHAMLSNASKPATQLDVQQICKLLFTFLGTQSHPNE